MMANSPEILLQTPGLAGPEQKPFLWVAIPSAVRFHRHPEVLEGSTIVVTKKPPEPPPQRKEFDPGGTVKDSFAVVASAATMIYLISQIKK
jgi:hypothetical protein